MNKKEREEESRLKREHEIMTYQENLPMAMLELIADAQDNDVYCRLTKDDVGIVTLCITYDSEYEYLATDSTNECDYDVLRNIIDGAKVDREESELQALVKKKALAKLTKEEIKLLGIK